MGVSSTGRARPLTSVRFVLLLVLAFGGWFAALYGPPLVPSLVQAAADRCNVLTGSDYRSGHVVWVSPAHGDRAWPHWECLSSRRSDEPVDLGWWIRPS